MTYLIVFIVLLFFAFYYYYMDESKSYDFAKLIAFVIFVLLAGLRYEIGYDYFAYSYHFHNGQNLNEFLENGLADGSYEVGFSLFSMLVKSFTDNPQWLFLSASFLCSIFLFRSLSLLTERKYFFLSVLTYYSFVYLLLEMQALRQSLAASLSYIAWVYIVKNDKKKAFVFALIAFLFHDSALFLIPMFFLSRVSIPKTFQVVSLFLSSLVMLFQIRWFLLFSNLLSLHSSLFSKMAKIMLYVDGTQRERGVFVLFFVYVALYLFFLLRRSCSNQTELNDNLKIYQNIFFFFLLVTSLFWEVNYISTRLGWYLLFGFVLVFPYIAEYFVFFRPSFAIIFIVVICFVPVRHFVWPDATTKMFSPYESYIECQILENECTGRIRTYQYAKYMGTIFRY